MSSRFTLRVSRSGLYLLVNDKGFCTHTRLTVGSLVANMKYISSPYFKAYDGDNELLDNSTEIATFDTYEEFITNHPELLL